MKKEKGIKRTGGIGYVEKTGILQMLKRKMYQSEEWLYDKLPQFNLGGERNRNQEFVFRFRQCRCGIFGRKKTENLLFSELI